MPQLPESLEPKGVKERPIDIEWRTISYKTVWTVILVICAAAGAVVYVRYRDFFDAQISKVVGHTASTPATGVEQRQARFLNIDGTVRVKKANAVAWVNASPDLPLEKGDVVQTSGEGFARISFADGTIYQMKPDTLVVVEDNSRSASAKTTSVSVTVTSGEVDLATTKFAGESKVMFRDAVAKLAQDSRASVKNDPKTQTGQITMQRGQSEVMRGGAAPVVLGSYEQMQILADGKALRTRVAGPPLLLTPVNQAPIFTEGDKLEVNFSWTPVPNAKSYRLRVSSSPIFSKVVLDRRVASSTVKVGTLPEGTYYWAVASIDEEGRESQVSDANKFELRKHAQDEILLEFDSVILHGSQAEIVGRTEPGARVMVNDQPVFAVQPDGTFKHFTQPLPAGPNKITVTAQNSKGQYSTRSKTVYIQ